MGLNKIIKFCTTKDIIKKVKKQPIAWEKIFTYHLSNKELLHVKKESKITKSHL